MTHAAHRMFVAAMLIFVLAVTIAPAVRADENGDESVEKRCYDPGTPILEDPEILGPCQNDSECGSGEKCGGCSFLSDFVALIVAGINELCDLPGDADCVTVTSDCQRITQELFAGTTLTGDPGDADWACDLGGRGQLMGEAALCMLRDLAKPAVGSPGPGIVKEASIDFGFLGESSVTQHVGFLEFDRDGRTMSGYHNISVRLPVLGNIDDESQKFTARLLKHSPANPGGLTCGDYALGDSYGLEISVDDSEHRLDFTIPAITVQTPIGPFSIKPEAHFHTFLKEVLTSFEGAPALQGITTRNDFLGTDCNVCDGGIPARALLTDVYGRVPGANATAAGRDWMSQVGLGGRDAEQDSLLWTPTPSDRPDVDLGVDSAVDPHCACPGVTCQSGGDPGPARNDIEHMPAGDAGAALPIKYALKELIGPLIPPPLLLRQAEILVRPALGTSFASQFNMSFSEGRYRPAVEFGCGPRIETSTAQVLMPNAVDAHAFFEILIRLDFKMKIDLGPFGKPTIINVHPQWKPVNTAVTKFHEGPTASARSDADPNGTAPTSPTYTSFQSFSGATGGEAFVHECLTEPAPPTQELPTPSYAPDPDGAAKLAHVAIYPCNLCLAFDGEYDTCLPTGGVAGLDDEAAEARSDQCVRRGNQCIFCATFDDGGNCVDSVEGSPLCTKTTVDLRDYVDEGARPTTHFELPVPMPPDRRWRCDSSRKLGCTDFCSYDPTAAQPYTVVESALDQEGGEHCGLPPESGVFCGSDAQCDDGNPCTDDHCIGLGGCTHSDNSAPCDDRLHCNGTDQCSGGSCEVHEGNPCSVDTTGAHTCDESLDECASAEQCATGLDEDDDDLIDCDDPICQGVACQCLPIGRDPGAIRFGAPGAGHDYFTAHGTVQPCAAFDPSTDEVGVLLTNADGVVYQATLPPGALRQHSRQRFTFRDPAARRARSGIYRFDVVYRPSRDRYQLRLQSYGDLSAATESLMSLQLRFGSHTFFNSSTWQEKPNGWVLTLPGE